MAEHHAHVTVNAPKHQVYQLFTHFNDFPKFMHFVKEVSYTDARHSHWVVELAGRHEWDAVNDEWIGEEQIGWRSIKGLENTGKVIFEPIGDDKTQVEVIISYNPPAGILGELAEGVSVGRRFELALQEDLTNFARMVEEAPPGALDPQSSAYLFNSDSAAARGETTEEQRATGAS